MVDCGFIVIAVIVSAVMRTSRLLSRLRRDRHDYSPFSCSISRIHAPLPSLRPENSDSQDNQLTNHLIVLQYDTHHPRSFTQRKGLGAFGSFLARSSSSRVVSSSNLILPNSSYHHQLHFTRGEFFLFFFFWS